MFPQCPFQKQQRRIKEEFAFHSVGPGVTKNSRQGISSWGLEVGLHQQHSMWSSQWLRVSELSLFLYSLWIVEGENNLSFKFVCLCTKRSYILIWDPGPCGRWEIWGCFPWMWIEEEKRKEYWVMGRVVYGWLHNCLLIPIPSPSRLTENCIHLPGRLGEPRDLLWLIWCEQKWCHFWVDKFNGKHLTLFPGRIILEASVGKDVSYKNQAEGHCSVVS